LHDPLDVLRVWITGTIVHCRLVYRIVCCMACLSVSFHIRQNSSADLQDVQCSTHVPL
jgi:hypothetical protein